MNSIARQFKAAQMTGYGAIWLRRSGDHVVVEIERNGQWYEVIREYYNDSNFSHIIEPIGIERALTKAGAMGIKSKS